MYIRKLEIKNFKSIKKSEIILEPFTIFVGANAAGKSNIINVLRFIKDIINEGIDNAIALQGGITYLANANMNEDDCVEIAFTLDLSDQGWVRKSNYKNILLPIREINYRFSIKPHKRGTGYRIFDDFLDVSYLINTNDSINKDKNDFNNIMHYTVKRTDGKKRFFKEIKFEKNDVNTKLMESIEDVNEFFEFVVNENKKEPMLSSLGTLLPIFFNESRFIQFFDFDPQAIKKTSSIKSRIYLQEDGSNLASVLRDILYNKANKRKLTIILKTFLPFVENIFVESNFDKSYSYKITESYSDKTFHSGFLSDGTVSIIAIIVALYFQEKSNILILEEPERNIHPKLLPNIISSSEEVSKEKQVIMTTHNPELLSSASLKNIRIVKRDDTGATVIKSPESSTVVREFLNNDLGIGELFLEDLLGE